MAKNTYSYEFRKIDVDQYNEDNYKGDEIDQNAPPDVGPNEAEIVDLLNKGKYSDAVKSIVLNAPLKTKDRQLKEHAFQVALKVLMAIKVSQMDEVLASLNVEQLDILMKYIYRGFEQPTDNSSAHLLTWHEKVFSISGLGGIVRVLTDRKMV